MNISRLKSNSLHIEDKRKQFVEDFDKHIFGECEKYNDICLCSDFSEDGIHVKRVWIEDPSFNYQNEIEIMPAYSRTIGPQMGVIETIEVLVNGRILGKLQLSTGLSDIDVSVLEYHKYKFSPII